VQDPAPVGGHPAAAGPATSSTSAGSVDWGWLGRKFTVPGTKSTKVPVWAAALVALVLMGVTAVVGLAVLGAVFEDPCDKADRMMSRTYEHPGDIEDYSAELQDAQYACIEQLKRQRR